MLAQTARSGEPLGDWSPPWFTLLADVLHFLPSFTFSRVLQNRVSITKAGLPCGNSCDDFQARRNVIIASVSFPQKGKAQPAHFVTAVEPQAAAPAEPANDLLMGLTQEEVMSLFDSLSKESPSSPKSLPDAPPSSPVGSNTRLASEGTPSFLTAADERLAGDQYEPEELVKQSLIEFREWVKRSALPPTKFSSRQPSSLPRKKRPHDWVSLIGSIMPSLPSCPRSR